MRRGQEQECRPRSEEGLDFQQFVAAVGGVIELLTVGCDDGARVGLSFGVGGVLGVDAGVGDCSRERLSFGEVVSPRGRGSHSPGNESGKIEASRSVWSGASAARSDGKREHDGSGNGGGGGREADGGRCRGRRKTAMTPELAEDRLVRLAKVRRGGG